MLADVYTKLSLEEHSKHRQSLPSKQRKALKKGGAYTSDSALPPGSEASFNAVKSGIMAFECAQVDTREWALAAISAYHAWQWYKYVHVLTLNSRVSHLATLFPTPSPYVRSYVLPYPPPRTETYTRVPTQKRARSSLPSKR